MKYLISFALLSFSVASYSMHPPAAMNPAGIHTMHHSANVTSPQTGIHASNSSVDGLNSGSQYYSASLSGLRRFVNTLKHDKPDAFSHLDQKLSKLEMRQTLSWVVFAAGAIGGFALARNQDIENPDTTTPTVLILGSLFGSLYIRPSRDDYFEFINENNRINPSQKLNMAINLKPLTEGLGLNLAFNF